MQTINNIRFEDTLYSQAEYLAILLCHKKGSHVTTLLSNAPFIQIFNDVEKCENYIEKNKEKKITLFIDEDNIEWLAGNSYLTDVSQVETIYICCLSLNEQHYWTEQTQCFRRTIREVFLHEELNFKLLLFGLNHIDKVRKQYFDDYGVLNRLDDDYKKISRALAVGFWKKSITANDRIRESEQTQS